jgi:hypothetical protein
MKGKIMKRTTIATALLPLLAALIWAAPATAAALGHGGVTLYGYVVLWDVAPGQAGAFEAKLHQSAAAIAADPSFHSERVLRNIDPLTSSYATYTRATDRSALEDGMRARIAALRPYLRRDPETHLAVVTQSYRQGSPDNQPTAADIGHGGRGQIAHLGLFIPYPDFLAEYQRTLDHVKVFTRDRIPQGYLGEDVLVEAELVQPETQTPYSPHPEKASKMSINYGEYETIEDAENSYIKRAGDRPKDPQIVVWERLFYSAIQVPTRFYIFQVVSGISGPSLARASAGGPAAAALR